MITDNKSTYQEAKYNVLAIHETFMDLSQNDLVKEVLKPSKNILDSLNNEIERVKEDKFKLMVAGEAKCGKSTFINAYLGVDILPMDVMQCTSSIIEIKYGEEFLLEAEYANGSKEQIKGENNIRQFLKENAAIDEKYRSIPVPVINTEILIKTKGKPTKLDTKNLIEGVKDANVHNLLKEDYEQKIREYIELRKDTWESIVVKLIVSYPFESEELKGIEIIDSPGVNAAGKIGDSTEQYIKNADAIMFLKPLTGAALESSDFKHFLEESSKEKSENALFLILTRASDSKEDDIQVLCKQASQLYKGISNQQILPVDSKVQMYKQKIKDMSSDEIQHWIIEGLANNTIDKFVAAPWMMSGMNVKVFRDELEKIARFEVLNRSMEKFGRKAHYIRLNDVLFRIDKLVKKAEELLIYDCGLYERKIKNPEQFVIDIANLENEFNEIENKMFEGIDEIKDEFLGVTGKVKKTASALSGIYREKFSRVSSSNYNEIKELSEKAIEEYSNLFTKLQAELIEICNKKLMDLTNVVEIPYAGLEVSITPEEFKNIEEKAKEKATKSEDISSGLTFKKVEQKSVFNENAYTKIIKDSLITRFNDISTDSTNVLKAFTSDVLKTYKNKLMEQAEEYVNRLHTIRKESSENNVLITKVNLYKEVLAEVQQINCSNGKVQMEVEVNVPD